ncbi:MAG: glycerol-3-phosphate dehydrogenase/oxidase [Planctomycetaceae bacterium]|nr:glycerol-3-phosphate dehydrogenase/oxidase [Planctomycetaceae bacterium]
MKRATMLERLSSESFDIIVIGGGATGLGVAVDAASRGYRVALVEAHDFAKATSSRSTKLVHGGVRYLEQLNFSLVVEALRERGIMYRNAPHLVSNLAFIVPRYHWWEGPFYGIGLKLYDTLAGKLNIENSRFLNREETIDLIPNVQQEDLIGGIKYHDGQFDDARMAITLARTAADHGAAIANYLRMTGFIKEHGRIIGVHVQDELSGSDFDLRGKAIINATGIFSDQIRQLDDPQATEMIEPAQGVHLVLDRSFQPGDNAIMVPHTDDGRVLFVIPWHERVIVGTTDTPMEKAELEPRALPDELEFILRNAARYMERDPQLGDIRSVFAGQRPLVHPGGKSGNSKSVSRNHEVYISESGLVTISGGKWTTYRKMAEDTLTHAIEVGQLTPQACVTEELHLHGYLPREELPTQDHLHVYGAEAAHITALTETQPALKKPIHPDLPYSSAEIVWAARHEMACHLEDVLARRTRSLLLDAHASTEAAEAAALLMADELGFNQEWIEREVANYRNLARGYLPPSIV